MSIASELTALNGHILDSYDEISTMGGTVPANKNMANMATAIASIPSGGGGSDFTDFLSGSLTNIEDSNLTSLRKDAFYYYQILCSISFPNLTSVGVEAFAYSYVQSISLPQLTSISTSNVFQGCSKLTTVYVPLLRTLGTNTFKSCTSLQKLDFPKMNGISSSSFSGCSNLKTLIIRTSQLCSLASTNAFTSTPIANGTGYVYVPSSLVSTYKTASVWSNFANQIRAIEDYSDDGTVDGDINV